MFYGSVLNGINSIKLKTMTGCFTGLRLNKSLLIKEVLPREQGEVLRALPGYCRGSSDPSGVNRVIQKQVKDRQGRVSLNAVLEMNS